MFYYFNYFRQNKYLKNQLLYFYLIQPDGLEKSEVYIPKSYYRLLLLN